MMPCAVQSPHCEHHMQLMSHGPVHVLSQLEQPASAAFEGGVPHVVSV